MTAIVEVDVLIQNQKRMVTLNVKLKLETDIDFLVKKNITLSED